MTEMNRFYHHIVEGTKASNQSVQYMKSIKRLVESWNMQIFDTLIEIPLCVFHFNNYTHLHVIWLKEYALQRQDTSLSGHVMLSVTMCNNKIFGAEWWCKKVVLTQRVRFRWHFRKQEILRICLQLENILSSLCLTSLSKLLWMAYCRSPSKTLVLIVFWFHQCLIWYCILVFYYRYCDCFANGEFCHNCNCNNCANNLEHEEERSRAIKSCLDRNPMAFHPKIGMLYFLHSTTKSLILNYKIAILNIGFSSMVHEDLLMTKKLMWNLILPYWYECL